MAHTLARFRGVALRPTISRNNRQYSREAIASAVARASKRIDEGEEPIHVFTSHGKADEDDTTHIVGKVTKLTLADDGSAMYEAELADTEHGRTVASLIDTTSGSPFLTGVSIRGSWAAPAQHKMVDGRRVEYAPDLELHGLDLTARPGVPGAKVTATAPGTGKPRETEDGRPIIYESVDDAAVVFREAAPSNDDGEPGCDGSCCKECGMNAAQEAARAEWLAEASRNPARHVFKDGRCVTCGY